MKKTLFILPMLIFLFMSANSQVIWYSESYSSTPHRTREVRPFDYQLYPRDNNNQGQVRLKGSVPGDSLITIRVRRRNFDKSISALSRQTISFGSGGFDYNYVIEAGLWEYIFDYKLSGQSTYTPLADWVVCGDVYIITGQSNALAAEDPMTPADRTWLDNNFGYNTSYGYFSRGINMWNFAWDYGKIMDGGLHQGAWGLYLQYLIQEAYGIPTCIINSSVGGTCIEQHVPNQNYIFDYDLTKLDGDWEEYLTGNLLCCVYSGFLENNIKGIFWWQGESDTDGTHSISDYLASFNSIFNTWHNYIELEKTYFVQIHSYTGNEYGNRYIGEAHRRIKSQFPDVELISSNGIEIGTKTNLHFHKEGYMHLAENNIFPILERDWYCKNTSIENVTTPNIQRAYFDNSKLILEFNQSLKPLNIDILANVLSVLKANEPCSFTNPSISGNKLSVNVSDNSISSISYLGYISDITNDYYLRNEENIAVLSFYDVPISEEMSDNSRSFPSNFSNNLTNPSLISLAPFAQGYLSDHLSIDRKANEIFTYSNTFVNSGDNINLTAGTSIIFNSGFKAIQGSQLKASVGNEYFAFTSSNNCVNKVKSDFGSARMDFGEYLGNNLSNEKNSDIILYPNPSDGTFCIILPVGNSKSNIQIYNSSGICVYSNQNYINYEIIDVTDVPPGFYFINIIVENESITKKIVLTD